MGEKEDELERVFGLKEELVVVLSDWGIKLAKGRVEESRREEKRREEQERKKERSESVEVGDTLVSHTISKHQQHFKEFLKQ